MADEDIVPPKNFQELIPTKIDNLTDGLCDALTRGSTFDDAEKSRLRGKLNIVVVGTLTGKTDVADPAVDTAMADISVILLDKGAHMSQAWADLVATMNDRKRSVQSLRSLGKMYSVPDKA